MHQHEKGTFNEGRQHVRSNCRNPCSQEPRVVSMQSAHLVLRLAGPGGVEREHHRKLKGSARVADDVELVLRCLRRRRSPQHAGILKP